MPTNEDDYGNEGEMQMDMYGGYGEGNVIVENFDEMAQSPELEHDNSDI